MGAEFYHTALTDVHVISLQPVTVVVALMDSSGLEQICMPGIT